MRRSGTATLPRLERKSALSLGSVRTDLRAALASSSNSTPFWPSSEPGGEEEGRRGEEVERRRVGEQEGRRGGVQERRSGGLEDKDMTRPAGVQE